MTGKTESKFVCKFAPCFIWHDTVNADVEVEVYKYILEPCHYVEMCSQFLSGRLSLAKRPSIYIE